MKEETISVVLGVFNKPNRYGHVYHVSEDKLKEIMDAKMGTYFGEMGFPELPNEMNEILARAQTIDVENNAGILKSYSIEGGAISKKNGEQVLTVKAEIIPSAKLSERIESGIIPYFGIRSLKITQPHNNFDNNKHYGVLFIGGFDLVVEPPHLDISDGIAFS